MILIFKKMFKTKLGKGSRLKELKQPNQPRGEHAAEIHQGGAGDYTQEDSIPKAGKQAKSGSEVDRGHERKGN